MASGVNFVIACTTCLKKRKKMLNSSDPFTAFAINSSVELGLYINGLFYYYLLTNEQLILTSLQSGKNFKHYDSL